MSRRLPRDDDDQAPPATRVRWRPASMARTPPAARTPRQYVFVTRVEFEDWGTTTIVTRTRRGATSFVRRLKNVAHVWTVRARVQP